MDALPAFTTTDYQVWLANPTHGPLYALRTDMPTLADAQRLANSYNAVETHGASEHRAVVVTARTTYSVEGD